MGAEMDRWTELDAQHVSETVESGTLDLVSRKSFHRPRVARRHHHDQNRLSRGAESRAP